MLQRLQIVSFCMSALTAKIVSLLFGGVGRTMLRWNFTECYPFLDGDGVYKWIPEGLTMGTNLNLIWRIIQLKFKLPSKLQTEQLR